MLMLSLKLATPNVNEHSDVWPMPIGIAPTSDNANGIIKGHSDN